MPLHSRPESAPRQTVPGGVLKALTARLGAVAAMGLGRVKSAIDLRGSQQPRFMDAVAAQQTWAWPSASLKKSMKVLSLGVMYWRLV